MLVAQSTLEDQGFMDGFDAGDRQLPGTSMMVPDEARTRAAEVIAAILCGLTPEDIGDCLTMGQWPRQVRDLLGQQGERDEMDAHLAVIMSVLDPAEVAAA